MTLGRQLQRLADAAALPHTTIQVLLFTSGLPPVSAGSFSILESFATEAPDVVYLENKSRIFFIESDSEVHGYARDFELLSTMALGPEESRAHILRAIERLKKEHATAFSNASDDPHGVDQPGFPRRSRRRGTAR